ncbi:MAG TPA: hypothetical protein VK963_01540 [Candidatus Saccharimonadales bacterium]|nr:hypothetical protein [Candidatus Saccharimonadales bacterium]
MVCQNCRSNDIVKIQEQLYCINCGQLVVEKAAPPAKIKTKVATDAVVTAGTAALPDQAAAAQAATVIVNHAAKTQAKSRVLAAPKAKPAKVSVKAVKTPVATSGAQTAAQAVRLQRPSGKSAAPAKVKSGGRRLSDLSQTQAGIALVSSVPASAAAVAAPRTDRSRPPRPATATSLRDTRQQSALSFATRATISNHYPEFALLAGLAGALSSLLAGWLMNSNLTAALWRSELTLSAIPSNLVTTAATIAGGLAVLYWIQLFAGSAIVCGAAAALDGRPSSPKRWSLVGIKRFWSVFGLDLLAVLSGLAVLTLEFLLLASWGSPAIEPGYLKSSGLLLGHVIIIYLALGVGLSRLLGLYPVVLAGMRPLPALRQGWHLYRRCSPHIVKAGLIALVANLLLWLIYAGSVTLLRNLGGTAGVDAVLLRVIGQFLLLVLLIVMTTVFNLAYWLKAYRQLTSPLKKLTQPEKTVSL